MARVRWVYNAVAREHRGNGVRADVVGLNVKRMRRAGAFDATEATN